MGQSALFNNSQTGGLFNNPAGTNSQEANPATGGLFGSLNPGGSSSLFQKENNSTLFGGNAPSNVTNQPNSGGLFGANNNGSASMFGGNPQQSGALFGGQNTAGTSLFGNN